MFQDFAVTMQRKTGISKYPVFQIILFTSVAHYETPIKMYLFGELLTFSYKDIQRYSNTLPYAVNWIQEIPQCKMWAPQCYT